MRNILLAAVLFHLMASSSATAVEPQGTCSCTEILGMNNFNHKGKIMSLYPYWDTGGLLFHMTCICNCMTIDGKETCSLECFDR